MIDVTHLTKWYSRVLAVDDISFHVEKGRIVGFLGPNGAGKSTTLKIITCFLPASAGTVRVNGMDVLSDSLAVRRQIGYMPENAPLYDEMRVREYLRFRASLRDIPAKQRNAAVESVCERCWLRAPEDMTRRRVCELSRGYKQRVGLAEVLLHNPPVLVLDEPTIGLDPAQIRAMRELIRDLGREHTVILSSHILAEVEQTCDDIIIIAGGRLAASGTPAELRQRVVGPRRVIAEIKGAAPKEIMEAVQALRGVSSVSSSQKNHWTRLNVEAADQGDPRGEIFQLAKSNNWDLRELRRTGGSLEDFFVQITYEQSMRLDRAAG